MTVMTSRERLQRTLGHQDVDHIPCCFMSFTALRKRHHEDMFALSRAELEMGLDSMLFIPAAGRPVRTDHPDLRGLPVRPHPDVQIREWREDAPGEEGLLHKEYTTPAGKLTTSIRLSDDWPHGDHIPFVDDYQIPRAVKPLITEQSELEALRYFFTPPSEEDRLNFKQEAERAHAFVAEHGSLLVGGWGVGLDMADWLCGIHQLMMLALDNPSMVIELVEMIHVWNMARMEVVLSGPVDLYIRRAWYEGCDFVVPAFYRDVILPRLKAEVDLAHEHGAKFGYICSSGTRPMLDLYAESGLDVLIGVDPVQGTYTDMPLMREKLGQERCLWGGVSGAVTVELGAESEVRAAVREAIATLGPDGFILSPVDNLTIDAPLTWQNVDVFIDEWRKNW
jgi:uroporphyrinogen-III decarboxylase